jgi:1,4-alpha-glucan branching enzyme
MLRKNYSKTGRTCRVTFKLPGDINAKTASLCGDFNHWDRDVGKMKQLKDGGFSITISLEPGRTYRFRYFLDGERWENDWAADDYLPNKYGSEDSVIKV